MSSSQDSSKKFEQQLVALRQELEAARDEARTAREEARTARSERDVALSSLATLQKAPKAANGADVVMQNGAEDGQSVKSPLSTLQDSDHSQTSGREDDIRSVSQCNLKDNKPSLKWQRRQLRQQILSRRVTKSMVREAVKLYDLEKGYASQSPDALSALERLFELDDIEWPSEHDRLVMISEKVAFSLKRTLMSYGYGLFTFYGEDQKGRLQISPRPGQNPPKLPQWLQIPYLVPVKGIDDSIIFEGCANPCIQRGDKIIQENNNNSLGM